MTRRAGASARRPRSAKAELHRARITVLAGVLVWLLLAAVVHLRYGLDAFLIVGWGCSMLVSLVFVVTPLLRTAPRERDVAASSMRRNPMVV